MKVLLAIDESEFSEAATKAMIEHVPVKGTTVCVLHVVPRVWYVGTESLEVVEKWEAARAAALKRGKQLVTGAERTLREAGFEVASMVVDGDPREVIIEQAELRDADLIMVGSHGRRGWRRLVLGSVSEAVARYAPCSVQIVRAHAAAKPGRVPRRSSPRSTKPRRGTE